MRRVLIHFIVLALCFAVKAQVSPIEVTSKTFKLGVNQEEIYYAFAAGDEILFDFEVIDGKPVKELEILEYPESSKFMEWKCKTVEGKKIKVKKDGIYIFRFRNGGLGRKVCRVNIQRIPSDDSKIDFNSSVIWKTRNDTTWIEKTKKELESVDTIVTNLIDRTERVHSQTNLSNSNVSSFGVNLPKNEITHLRTKKVISWAYWIGVGNEGNAAYEAAKKDFLLKNAAKVSTLINPLAGLAIGAYAIAVKQPKGDNIHFWLTAYYNDGSRYTIGTGNSVIAYSKHDRILQGGFRVKLQNDNLTNGINVNVKITVVQEIRRYKEVPYLEPDIISVTYPDFTNNVRKDLE